MIEKDALSFVSDQVKKNRIVLYMKGSPEFPRCGFSKEVADVLEHLGARYLAVDVLLDNSVREAIKVYGSWPTIPQLYVDGELIGGRDIVLEMFRDGSLSKIISIS